MQTDRELTFADLRRALDAHDPQLPDLVVRYLAQPDPPENCPEDPPADGEESDEPLPALPPDTWTLQKLKQTVFGYQMGQKTATERKVTRRDAWAGLGAAPYPPPRLALAEILIDLYERGTPEGRAALVDIFRRGRIGWGLWKAMKTVYKLAEARHDAEFFGLLAWRLDAYGSQDKVAGEISKGTFAYLQRRAWRYLRHLGQSVPELFPHFATQVLRHYPRGASFSECWVAHQIWNHEELVGESTLPYASGPPKKLKNRAFNETWKLSPEPLLRLLEDAQADQVCRFAISGLHADFPESLSDVAPEWLRRIGDKRLASVDGFIVKLLNDTPAFHQSKLQGLDLESLVLQLLRSENADARKYAIAYVQGFAGDLPLEHLMELALEGAKEVSELAVTRLGPRSPEELGLGRLVKLLGTAAGQKMAAEKLRQGFAPTQLEAPEFITLYTGGNAAKSFLEAWFKDAEAAIPAALYTALLDAPEGDAYWVRRDVLKVLAKRKGGEIGRGWIEKAVLDPRFTSEVSRWLRAGKLAGDDLDVEWVKGLTLRPKTRPLALALLGDRKLVSFEAIGLPWLLAMARQANETLHQFAHRYLLEHVSPRDFGGADKLWELAYGAKQPEPLRLFAATYLRVHHPELGKGMAETRSYGLKAKLSKGDFGKEHARACLFDVRADVRRLGVAVARAELAGWGDQDLLYALADAPHREPRVLAAELLLAIGEESEEGPLDATWLQPAAVFGLAESHNKATREIALSLIRRHYRSLGGAEKLAWLMESPDREVRLASVRLLWERHRPVAIPKTWTPKKGKAPQLPRGDERFESSEALRHFLRTVLFGLPPGRLERREGADALPDRALPASVAKKRLVAVVRDMGEESAEFAEIVVPVLEEFTASVAKGEWQSCVAALARIRKAHPTLAVGLPMGTQQAS